MRPATAVVLALLMVAIIAAMVLNVAMRPGG